jgi:CheY-like chemotaxis protein
MDMARKRALVVDDSKSARVILSRMLEKYDIEVDMAESAEQSIEYLKHNRPDAIFMDHLMPGMDGLQAVQAIKGNPQTAMIPIMMYTSQEGELYVGQARALGAMGVLPKQVRPVDVSKVLYELHLLPDRRDMNEPALVPVEIEGGTPVERALQPKSATVSSIDWGRRVEAAVKDQAVDIRRFIVASLDSFAGRIITDMRESLPIVPANDSIAPPPKEAAQSGWWPAAALVGCLAAAAFAAGWMVVRNDLAHSREEMAALSNSNAQMTRERADLSSAVKDLTAALAAANAAAGPNAPAPFVAAPSAPPRIETVPYGEIPFDRARLDVLRDMLGKLETQGFHGVLKVTNMAGLFCLTANGSEGYVPAMPTIPVSKCDVIGNPFEESLSGQQRQSLAFANLIAGARQRTAGAISVVVETAGSSKVATAYPPRSDGLTAGEWNRAASANNRVEYTTEAAP